MMPACGVVEKTAFATGDLISELSFSSSARVTELAQFSQYHGKKYQDLHLEATPRLSAKRPRASMIDLFHSIVKEALEGMKLFPMA